MYLSTYGYTSERLLRITEEINSHLNSKIFRHSEKSSGDNDVK